MAIAERCYCWIPEPGKMTEYHGKMWPAGHKCPNDATHYQRIGEVVEHVCRECYQRDTARGAQPSSAQEYEDYLERDDV